MQRFACRGRGRAISPSSGQSDHSRRRICHGLLPFAISFFPESKRRPCNLWFTQPFGKRVHLSAAIVVGILNSPTSRRPLSPGNPPNRRESPRWQGIRLKEERRERLTFKNSTCMVPPPCTYTLSKSRPASCFMLGPVSSCRSRQRQTAWGDKARYLPRPLSWVNPSMGKGGYLTRHEITLNLSTVSGLDGIYSDTGVEPGDLSSYT